MKNVSFVLQKKIIQSFWPTQYIMGNENELKKERHSYHVLKQKVKNKGAKTGQV